MNIFMRRTYKVALLATACTVLSPLAATAVYAADVPPPVAEGESDFAESVLTDGVTPGVSALRAAAAADPRTPATPFFGPAIDAYAASDGQTTCDPVAKPGAGGAGGAAGPDVRRAHRLLHPGLRRGWSQ